MPARDLGTKHVCFKCGTKFYDLKKPEAICPKCGSDQRDSPANRPPEPRKGRLSAPKVVAPEVEEPEVAAEEEEADVESFEEEGEEEFSGEEDEA
jgi:uncharacterized protein (TIGR02300 family)